jgi:DNA transformation protein
MAGNEEHLQDLFAPLGGVSMRRMFGGVGIFKGGLMFALVAGDVLFMKADEATRARFAAEGCGPFTYEGRATVTMPYWEVPLRLFDEPDEFAEWAATAFEVALRTRKVAKPRMAAKAAPGKSAKPAPGRKTGKAPTRGKPATRGKR